MRAQLPSGTVTFLFTDIEASTRLLHAVAPDAYAEALSEHRRKLRAAFEGHDGVEVDTQGDAFFVAFPRAHGAVAAAEAGQRALEDDPIRVRMGLHTGTPTVTGEGYVGVDVQRGARAAARAHGRRRRPGAARCSAAAPWSGARHRGDGGAPRRGRAHRPRSSPSQGLRRADAGSAAGEGRVPLARASLTHR